MSDFVKLIDMKIPEIRIKLSGTIILRLLLAGIFLNSCVDIYELDKYKHPDWLAGKLYTQVAGEENLKQFAECLRLTGYDTILDLSGSFTVFAPSDEAFTQYFILHPEYGNSVSGIPDAKLQELVQFHIIQNAWSRAQLQRLDIGGWIDPTDPESEPRAYKRQTLMREDNTKFWVKSSKGNYTIVDSSAANGYRIVFNRSRKYVPIFFPEFFSIYDVVPDDYQFYFNRPFEGRGIYYAGAKLSDEEIFAENGFVYVIDKVIEPLLNAKQFLEKEYPGESYKTFLDLIYLFPEFETNLEATYDQQEAREGKKFDTLYNLSFSGLPFAIHEELTGPNINVVDYTYLYQNGVFVPTDEAFQKFLNEVVTTNSGYPHWTSFSAVPLDIKKIILNTHLSTIPVYRTNITEGFENAYGNIITIDENKIIRKEFGSNCTFIGLNEAVVPKAFSSVTGPVYLRPGYSIFMYAMQYARVLSALTSPGEEFLFFPLPDNVMLEDSSLMFIWDDIDLNRYHFNCYDRSTESMVNRITRKDMTKRILNQVGNSLPDGSANKEYIENLAGNYIIWDNINNNAQGGKPNVFGWNGDSIIDIDPVLLEEPTDNGKTYTVKGWFQHVRTDMYGALSGFPRFKSLLEKAGLYDPKLYQFIFLTEGESYTIFIPSDEALNNYQVDTLTKEDLANFLKYHFVKGEKIFTDGKKMWTDYETLRVDESSTQYSTYYSTLNIRPGSDIIEILNAAGNPYITIEEKPGMTNILVATDSDPSPTSTSGLDYITTSVIHKINNVLIKQ